MQLFLRIPRVANAFQFMVEAHHGQMYGNLPYFVHPLMVAEEVYNQFPDADEDTLIIALLHDVKEDTDRGHEISSRFGDNVDFGVDLVSKDNTLSYQDNILRIITSKFIPSIRVKWSDNRVNMSGDKSGMSQDRRDRLNKKYAESFVLLSSVLGI